MNNTDDDDDDDDHATDNDNDLTEGRRPLSAVEKRDLFGAIEHLIIQGNSQRLANWRRNEFHKRQQQQQLQKIDELKDFRSVHAQDVRLYNVPHEIGIDLTDLHKTWPKKPEKWSTYYTDRQLNKQWDFELSDGIHPIRFTKQRLSLQQHSQGTKTTTTTSSSYALLLHCWERAVHAASSTVTLSDNPTTHLGKSNVEQTKTSTTIEAAKEACRKYQIEELLHSTHPPYKCPNGCHDYMQFESYEHLSRHFYGDTSLRGCCWNIIQKKRQKLITNLLQNEIRRQRNQLLQFIMQKEFMMTNDTTSSIKDWKDVLFYCEQKVASASTLPPVPTQPAWMHTLQVGTTRAIPNHKPPPLPINMALLEAVRHRLIERYALVPR